MIKVIDIEQKNHSSIIPGVASMVSMDIYLTDE